MKFEQSRQLQQRSHAVIPGGAHTYAKGDDQFPVEAPGFLVRGEGCRVWDPDGNEFIEYGMGLRSVSLGHGYAPVVEAAARAMAQGTNFTRPSPPEVELAERLVGLIDAAEMAKFAKNGSDATTAALKLARAYTGRDKLLYCRSHPFFSTDDWFIGTTPMRAGIPRSVSELSIGFDYNDTAGLETLLAAHASEIACVILEPATSEEPRDGFLHNAVAAWLRQKTPAAAFLFHGYGLQRLTYCGAREIFRKYLRKAGLADKGYSLHCLRHTFASELLNAGMRLECLQKLLGHTSVEVTRRYARLTDKTREEEYFKAMEKIEKGEIDGHY